MFAYYKAIDIKVIPDTVDSVDPLSDASSPTSRRRRLGKLIHHRRHQHREQGPDQASHHRVQRSVLELEEGVQAATVVVARR
jgi:hypothetical protein